MKEKIAIAAMSAMLSGGLTVAMNTANTAGRLTAVEHALERIEQRIDAALPQGSSVARAATGERP